MPVVVELLVTECGVVLRKQVVTSHHLREIAVTASIRSLVHTYHTSRQNTHKYFVTSQRVRRAREIVDCLTVWWRKLLRVGAAQRRYVAHWGVQRRVQFANRQFSFFNWWMSYLKVQYRFVQTDAFLCWHMTNARYFIRHSRLLVPWDIRNCPMIFCYRKYVELTFGTLDYYYSRTKLRRCVESLDPTSWFHHYVTVMRWLDSRDISAFNDNQFNILLQSKHGT